MAQGMGWISTVIFLISDLQDDDAKLDHYYTLGNVFFVFHLLLLQAWIPAATVSLAIARNLINRRHKSTAVKITFLAIFILIFFW